MGRSDYSSHPTTLLFWLTQRQPLEYATQQTRNLLALELGSQKEAETLTITVRHGCLALESESET